MCAEEHGESEVQEDVDAEEAEEEGEAGEARTKREWERAELQGQFDGMWAEDHAKSGVCAAKLECKDEGTGGDCMYGVQNAVYDPYH